MKHFFAVLDKDHNVVPVEGGAHADWRRENQEALHVGLYETEAFTISTVFLGINHGFGERDLWFETMIFCPDDEFQIRYETWEQATVGHQTVLHCVRDDPELFKSDGWSDWLYETVEEALKGVGLGEYDGVVGEVQS